MGYTSTSRPLAVLEMLVHVTRDTFPAEVALIPIDVPDELITELKPLPQHWNEFPYHAASQVAGDRWIHEGASAGLLVPSAVLPLERNLLINPLHPEFKKIRIHAAEEPGLDPRLFT